MAKRVSIQPRFTPLADPSGKTRILGSAGGIIPSGLRPGPASRSTRPVRQAEASQERRGGSGHHTSWQETLMDVTRTRFHSVGRLEMIPSIIMSTAAAPRPANK